MSPSAVSHAVRSVEDRLGTPLFARTTRSVSVTEAGARFIARVEPALADIGKAVEGLTAERGQVTGLLRIEAPRGVLDAVLAAAGYNFRRLIAWLRFLLLSILIALGFAAKLKST